MQSGRVLILDEVDKAPLEVVCVLKGLVGDGELVLYDGRRILNLEKALNEYQISPVSNNHDDDVDILVQQYYNNDKSNADKSDKTKNLIKIFASNKFQKYCLDNSIIPMHPEFKLFCLANRPGHPFLGNHFFKECGDLFVVHVVENLDRDSEISLLQSFAPEMDIDTLTRLSQVFADLRKLNEHGILAYPFSAREAVALARHLETYPQDKIEGAAENILGFDGMNVSVRAVAHIFVKMDLMYLKKIHIQQIKLSSGKMVNR